MVIPEKTINEVTAAVAESLPGFAASESPYPDMLAAAGFTAIKEDDVTEEYRVTSARWQDVSLTLGDELKAALGADRFEEKRENRARSLAAIEVGALGRRFYTARLPTETITG